MTPRPLTGKRRKTTLPNRPNSFNSAGGSPNGSTREEDAFDFYCGPKRQKLSIQRSRILEDRSRSLYEVVNDKDEEKVDLLDVDKTAVEWLIKYVSNDLPNNTWVDNLDDTILCDLLNLSNRYVAKSLTEIIINTLIRRIKVDNVVELYRKAVKMGSDCWLPVQTTALKCMATHVDELEDSQEMLRLSRKSVSSFLKEALGVPNCNVIKLYKLLTRWWEAQQFMDTPTKLLPQELLDILHLERLTLDEVLEHLFNDPVSRNLLDSQYVTRLIKRHFSERELKKPKRANAKKVRAPASVSSGSDNSVNDDAMNKNGEPLVAHHSKSTLMVATPLTKPLIDFENEVSDDDDSSVEENSQQFYEIVDDKKKEAEGNEDSDSEESMLSVADQTESTSSSSEDDSLIQPTPIRQNVTRKIQGKFRNFARNFKLQEYTKLSQTLKSYWNLHIPISIIVNGVTMFQIEQESPEPQLVISFPTGAKEIMSGIPATANVFSLTLIQSTMPPNTFPFQSLRKVVLYCVDVDTRVYSLSEFLRKCTNLEDVSCWVDIPNPSKIKENKRRAIVELSTDLPTDKLKRLALLSCIVRCGWTLSNNSSYSFNALTELYLDCIYWADDVINQFHLIFPALKTIVLRCPVYLPKPRTGAGLVIREKKNFGTPVKLLAELLQIESLASIQIFNMNWSSGPPMEGSKRQELVKLLRQAGVDEKNQPNNFILTKNKRGTWRSQILKYGSKKYLTTLGDLEFNYCIRKTAYKNKKTFEDFSPEGQSEPGSDDDN